MLYDMRQPWINDINWQKIDVQIYTVA